jgi:hypothetical protein
VAIGSTTVVAPDGRRWKVRRRWAPRLGAESAWGRFRRRVSRTARRTGDLADAPTGCLDVFGEGIAIAVAVIAVTLIVVFVILPLVVAVVDLVFVLLLALLGILARIAFRRPWTVDATADDGEAHTWRIVGWRASGDQVTRAAEHLAAGLAPPAPAGVVDATSPPTDAPS